MNLNKKNIKYLILSIYGTFLSIGWLILLFILARYEFIHDPMTYIPAGIIVGLILIVPSFFFVRAIIRIKKNSKEIIKIKTRSIVASLLIISLLTTFTVLVALLSTVPMASLLYKYKEGPYLIWNDDPKTTMTIIWVSDTPEDFSFKYGKTPALLDQIGTISSWLNRYVVELKSLVPGTQYYYQVAGLSNKLYNFTTGPNSLANFNFTVIGDNRNGGGTSLSNYSDVINAMNPYDYDFIINVGDVYNNGMDFDSMHEFLGNMVMHGSTHPYMIAIGNHEFGIDIAATNFKHFFPYSYINPFAHYYSFTYSNAHFIIIDNFDNIFTGGHQIMSPQYEWVKQELAANQDKWLFVAFHVPPLSTGDFNMDERLIEQLCPLFYEYKVDVVLTGHDHHYEAFWVNRTEAWGGTYYFISGGGGASLDNGIMSRETNPWKHKYHNASIEAYQDDYITLHDQIYGELTLQFMHFSITGNTLKAQSIRANGSLIHEMTITK